MSRTALLALLGACGLTGYFAHAAGYQSALRAAPEMVEYQREKDEEHERYMATIMAEPSGREMVCERIFDMVDGELRDEVRLEHDDMDRHSSERY